MGRIIKRSFYLLTSPYFPWIPIDTFHWMLPHFKLNIEEATESDTEADADILKIKMSDADIKSCGLPWIQINLKSTV